MRHRTLVVLLILAAAIVALTAQRTWRGSLRQQPQPPQPADSTATMTAPMVAADSADIRCSGFEKTLRSNIESFFVTNNTDSALSRLHLTIEYLDTSDRQLHRRSEPVVADIPAGQTRRIEIRSFDRQATFYYYLSAVPRTRATATPFKVRLHVDSIAH